MSEISNHTKNGFYGLNFAGVNFRECLKTENLVELNFRESSKNCEFAKFSLAKVSSSEVGRREGDRALKLFYKEKTKIHHLGKLRNV